MKLKPDLVLMDVHMPYLDGLTLSRFFTHRFPPARIGLMSSDNTPELRQACEESGALDFVHKENFRQEFHAALQHICSDGPDMKKNQRFRIKRRIRAMRTTLIKTFAFLALTSVFVLAQHGNPPDQAQMAQHHVDHLTKQLSLTPQQQQQATTLFTEVLKNSKTMHDQLRTAHESLRTAVQKNDTAAIEQISNSIGNLTAQETMTHAKAMATFYQTLTPEQQSKFAEAVHHGMGGEMGMHGHGGLGGPPPGASFQ